VFENYLTDFSSKLRLQSVREILFDLEPFGIDPELAFSVSFARVYVHRFVTFVGIEKYPPPLDQQYCRHGEKSNCLNGTVSRALYAGAVVR
jgi:hypothetical protein